MKRYNNYICRYLFKINAVDNLNDSINFQTDMIFSLTIIIIKKKKQLYVHINKCILCKYKKKLKIKMRNIYTMLILDNYYYK